MFVSYYCGAYGEGGGYFHDPDDCGATGRIEVDEDDWEDGCAYTSCPKCGAELSQEMGDLYEVEV